MPIVYRRFSQLASSCLSLRLKDIFGSHESNFYEILYLCIFRKCAEITYVELKPDNN